MKFLASVFCCAVLALAADKKPVPPVVVEGANEDVALKATLLLTPEDIHAALTTDLGPSFAIVRIQVTPNKKGDPIRVSPDDFTLLSRKDGERSPALSPSQIAG